MATLTDRLARAGVPLGVLVSIAPHTIEGIYARAKRHGVSDNRAVMTTAHKIMSMVSVRGPAGQVTKR